MRLATLPARLARVSTIRIRALLARMATSYLEEPASLASRFVRPALQAARLANPARLERSSLEQLALAIRLSAMLLARLAVRTIIRTRALPARMASTCKEAIAWPAMLRARPA